MKEISDQAWAYVRAKIDARFVPVEDIVIGLGKLSYRSCRDAGLTENQAEAIATLYDILVGASLLPPEPKQ